MVAGDGFTVVSEFFKHIAKVVVRLRIVGLKFKGLVAASDGLTEPSQFFEYISQIAMSFHMAVSYTHLTLPTTPYV